MKPFFSVILPIFNVENYLVRCVESILAQDFTDYEMILVDDGANDGSPMICDEFSCKFDFIKVVHKENGGLASARNSGLEVAAGKYILWVDPDDWIEENTLSSLNSSLLENDADIVKFNYYRHAEGCSSINMTDVLPGLYLKNKMKTLVDMALLSKGNYSLSAWSHVYNKEFLEKKDLKFFSEREVGSEDFLFNLEALLLAEKVLVTDFILYHYDLRIGSLTQKYREKLSGQYTKLFSKLIAWQKDNINDGELEKKICHFYIITLIHNTCFKSEYMELSNHSIRDGKKNVKRIMAVKEVKYALDNLYKDDLSFKDKIKISCMKLEFEKLFYYLFTRN